MKHKMYGIVFTLLCACILVQSVSSQTGVPTSKIKLNVKELKEVDNLMIVSHPDDEIIWGGAHLNHEKYFVVCLTSGNNTVRYKEFAKVLKNRKTPYFMLKYPDKIGKKRDQWFTSQKPISEDLKFIMNYKPWKKIVTHNPDGEYGHIHHKKTSFIVSQLYNNLHYKSELFYFGKYSKRRDMHQLNSQSSISKKDLKSKIDMMKIYESQRHVDKKMRHMYSHENWILSSNWK